MVFDVSVRSIVRNVSGASPYFGGKNRLYTDVAQWNMKCYGWEDDNEIEAARTWAFGEYLYGRQTFENIKDIVKRNGKQPDVKCGFEGRSGGWFVVYSPLTSAEVRRLDRYIKKVMTELPAFLKEERAQRYREEEARLDAERQSKRVLLQNPVVQQAYRDLFAQFGDDFQLLIKGVDVTATYAEILANPETVI